MAFYGQPQRKPGISLTAVGNNEVTITNNNPLHAYYPLRIVLEATAVAGYSAPATISLGTNSPNYDNIMAARSAVKLTSVGAVISALFDSALAVPAGTPIVLRVSIAATATTQTVKAVLLGLYD